MKISFLVALVFSVSVQAKDKHEACNASREQFVALRGTLTDRTANGCASEVRQVADICSNPPDEAGLQQFDAEKAARSGMTGAVAAQTGALRTARQKYQALRTACEVGKQRVLQACRDSLQSLEDAQNMNSQMRGEFEEKFRRDYRGFQANLHSDLYRATASFRESETEIRKDIENVRQVTRAADTALGTSVRCNESYAEAYGDAESESANVENMISSADTDKTGDNNREADDAANLAATDFETPYSPNVEAPEASRPAVEVAGALAPEISSTMGALSSPAYPLARSTGTAGFVIPAPGMGLGAAGGALSNMFIGPFYGPGAVQSAISILGAP